MLLTDTVGFIQKLPHQLVEAFRSTLDVVAEADLLLHVVDAAGPDPDVHIAAVRKVLREIGAGEVPELLVYNKCDLLGGRDIPLGANKNAIVVSAATGEGTDKLLAAMADELRSSSVIVELLVPYARGEVLAAVQRAGHVLSTENEDAGYRLQARLDPVSAARLSEWVVG